MIRLSNSSKFFLFLLCLLVSVPFANPYHGFPFTSLHTEWIALLLGCLICFFLILQKRLEFILSPLTSCLFLLALFIFLQGVFISGDRSFQTFSIASLYCIWAACIVSSIKTRISTISISPMLAWSIVLASLINCGFALYQHAQEEAVIGALAQANNFADYLFIGLLSLLYLKEKEKIKLYLFLPIIWIFIYSLMLSQSRLVILYFISGFCLLLYSYRKSITKEIAIITFCLIGILVIALSLYLHDKLVREWTLLGTGTYSADNFRLIMGKQAWMMFLERPWFGHGFNQFSLVAYNQVALHSHNLVLNLLAEIGIIGLFLTSLCFFVALRWTWLLPKEEHWYFLSVVSVLLIHSMFEFPLWYANFLGLLIIFCAIFDRSPYQAVRVYRTVYYSYLFLLSLSTIAVFSLPWTYAQVTSFVTREQLQSILNSNGEVIQILTPKNSGIGIRITKPE